MRKLAICMNAMPKYNNIICMMLDLFESLVLVFLDMLSQCCDRLHNDTHDYGWFELELWPVCCHGTSLSNGCCTSHTCKPAELTIYLYVVYLQSHSMLMTPKCLNVNYHCQLLLSHRASSFIPAELACHAGPTSCVMLPPARLVPEPNEILTHRKALL